MGTFFLTLDDFVHFVLIMDAVFFLFFLMNYFEQSEIRMLVGDSCIFTILFL